MPEDTISPTLRHRPRTLAETANELCIELRTARNILGDWGAGIRTSKISREMALACLYSAREGINELIAEIKGA